MWHLASEDGNRQDTNQITVKGPPTDGVLFGSSKVHVAGATQRRLQDQEEITCSFMTSTSCAECTAHVDCAWCLSSKKCVHDVQKSCPQGAEDHVGKVEGSQGTCLVQKKRERSRRRINLPGLVSSIGKDNKNNKDIKSNTKTGNGSISATTRCTFTEATTCSSCTAEPGCAWCYSSNNCVDDKEESCESGKDHVGRIEGVLQSCNITLIGKHVYDIVKNITAHRNGGIPIECASTDATNCNSCIAEPGCAWCLASNRCVNDKEDSCDEAKDHVGKLQGVLKSCELNSSTISVNNSNPEKRQKIETKEHPFTITKRNRFKKHRHALTIFNKNVKKIDSKKQARNNRILAASRKLWWWQWLKKDHTHSWSAITGWTWHNDWWYELHYYWARAGRAVCCRDLQDQWVLKPYSFNAYGWNTENKDEIQLDSAEKGGYHMTDCDAFDWYGEANDGGGTTEQVAPGWNAGGIQNSHVYWNSNKDWRHTVHQDHELYKSIWASTADGTWNLHHINSRDTFTNSWTWYGSAASESKGFSNYQSADYQDSTRGHRGSNQNQYYFKPRGRCTANKPQDGEYGAQNVLTSKNWAFNSNNNKNVQEELYTSQVNCGINEKSKNSNWRWLVYGPLGYKPNDLEGTKSLNIGTWNVHIRSLGHFNPKKGFYGHFNDGDSMGAVENGRHRGAGRHVEVENDPLARDSLQFSTGSAIGTLW